MANASPATPNPLADIHWARLLGASVCLVGLLFVFADVLTRQLVSRKEITLIIRDKWQNKDGAGVVTNQGTFGFPERGRRRMSRYIDFGFLWHDLREVSFPKLIIGCSYRVVMTSPVLFGYHDLVSTKCLPTTLLRRCCAGWSSLNVIATCRQNPANRPAATIS